MASSSADDERLRVWRRMLAKEGFETLADQVSHAPRGDKAEFREVITHIKKELKDAKTEGRKPNLSFAGATSKGAKKQVQQAQSSAGPSDLPQSATSGGGGNAGSARSRGGVVQSNKGKAAASRAKLHQQQADYTNAQTRVPKSTVERLTTFENSALNMKEGTLHIRRAEQKFQRKQNRLQKQAKERHKPKKDPINRERALQNLEYNQAQEVDIPDSDDEYESDPDQRVDNTDTEHLPDVKVSGFNGVGGGFEELDLGDNGGFGPSIDEMRAAKKIILHAYRVQKANREAAKAAAEKQRQEDAKKEQARQQQQEAARQRQLQAKQERERRQREAEAKAAAEVRARAEYEARREAARAAKKQPAVANAPQPPPNPPPNPSRKDDGLRDDEDVVEEPQPKPILKKPKALPPPTYDDGDFERIGRTEERTRRPLRSKSQGPDTREFRKDRTLDIRKEDRTEAVIESALSSAPPQPPQSPPKPVAAAVTRSGKRTGVDVAASAQGDRTPPPPDPSNNLDDDYQPPKPPEMQPNPSVTQQTPVQQPTPGPTQVPRRQDGFELPGDVKFRPPPSPLDAERRNPRMELPVVLQPVDQKQAVLEAHLKTRGRYGGDYIAREKIFDIELQEQIRERKDNFGKDFRNWLTSNDRASSTRKPLFGNYPVIGPSITRGAFNVPSQFARDNDRALNHPKLLTKWTPDKHNREIIDYIDSYVDVRQRFEQELTKLILRGPKTLNEHYFYYKYVIRGEIAPPAEQEQFLAAVPMWRQ